MELQVYLIIIAIFFVSLGSLIFVNRQLRSGKTFEEAMAEKRQLTEKLYGTNKKKNTNKKASTAKKVIIFASVLCPTIFRIELFWSVNCMDFVTESWSKGSQTIEEHATTVSHRKWWKIWQRIGEWFQHFTACKWWKGSCWIHWRGNYRSGYEQRSIQGKFIIFGLTFWANFGSLIFKLKRSVHIYHDDFNFVATIVSWKDKSTSS